MQTPARPDDRSARITGALFLVTFISAITGVILYGPVLSDPGYVAGAGDDVRVLLGVVCEIVLVISNLGTAIVLYPVLRRYHEAAAIGFVVARVIECVFIVVGMLSVLTVVGLRRDGGAGGSAEYGEIARALVVLHEWTFLLGPGFVVGIGNGLLLGFLMYRSRLVPRPLATIALVGGPLMSLSGIAVLFGAYGQTSVISGVLTLPEIVWEASLGLYLLVRGFRSAERPIRAGENARRGTVRRP
ncbi:DUF4386 domain-containing protein [Labedella phragmitis]|uniref:DUF4386 domain-containing protein n=1 Tax=Labedella phragmitis TaxID=2498849 RepID=A0A444PXM0_9MICO|nr:DUF4386 domain-containing protein [Labedella phragmitis]RWZ52567.1 DUF4386 domain-containing protein [Labedella phragmitis]